VVVTTDKGEVSGTLRAVDTESLVIEVGTGAQKSVEQCISSRVYGSDTVDDQDAFHAELDRHCGGHAGVIGLDGAGRDERVCAGRLRLCCDEPELSDLVSSKRERNRVVALDQQSSRASKHAAKMREFLAR